MDAATVAPAGLPVSTTTLLSSGVFGSMAANGATGAQSGRRFRANSAADAHVGILEATQRLLLAPLEVSWVLVRNDPALSSSSGKGSPVAASFYELSVPTFLQTVRAVGGFLDRAARHCVETGADPDDFVGVRLYADMAPFHFQIEAAWHHAVWGLEAAKTGVFAPPGLVGPVPFSELRAMIGKAEAALDAYTPDEVNSWAGRDLDLQIGPRRLAFTSETLILSFSLPNFYFHAVTAYDILRSRGVPIGKRDYEGQLRTVGRSESGRVENS